MMERFVLLNIREFRQKFYLLLLLYRAAGQDQ